MKLQPTPVEQEARRLGIPVLTPTTLKTPEALEEFRALHADAAVVVAYGMILPQLFWMRRRSAALTCTPRCCRAGAAQPDQPRDHGRRADSGVM